MVVGFAADGRADRVMGIDALAKPAQTRDQIYRIAKQTAEKVELNRDNIAKDIVLDERYGGPEYGSPSEGTMEAIRLCARLEGVLTDPVYEGRSMQAMHRQGAARRVPNRFEGTLRSPGRCTGAERL